MLATARTFSLDGISARSVRVEVDVHRGLPSFSIVGLPDTAIREARERVRAAIVNSGYEFPLRRITVNLAPANLRKVGPGLDLAMAAALLDASDQLDLGSLGPVCLAGELALDGRVRGIAGALAMAERARRDGATTLILPAKNGPEAALANGLRVVGIEHLAQLDDLVRNGAPPGTIEPIELGSEQGADGLDMADLRGQARLRQALEVAAAGGHNLLMIGPPGIGKSLAARRLPSILPPLSPEEALEVARIASAVGTFDPGRAGVRPFRAPHHTISTSGLIGGGTPPRPGEVTLAHRGVLFLDELGEFHRDALEALRSPIEDGTVTLVRSGGRVDLPCRFMVVAAANPCPCGRGEESPDCNCSPAAIRRYHAKLSGALADRIEIVVNLSRPAAAELAGAPGESSAEIRSRTTRARQRQEERLGPGRCNAEMTVAEARELPLTREAGELMAMAFERDRMSGRAHDRVLRLACTIADLEGEEHIDADQVAAALALRRRGGP